ncbi:MAG: endonuclease/exonuclease/phosphatase family protein [Pseudomonadota bacterium]
MTLNLRFGLAKDGPDGWHHRQQAYPSLFSSFPSDLYCFQEANDFQLRALSAWLPDHRPIGIRRPSPPFWQHTPIFFPKTWQLLAAEHIFLSATPHVPSRQRSSRWPRQCTIGEFRVGTHRLLCVNTHFDFAPETQRESARIIGERLQRYPQSVPCIVVGDFNARPGGRCHRLMTGGGWVPGRQFQSAFGASSPGSFHGFSGAAAERHIDWILYDGPVRVVSAAAVTQSFEGIYPSDHFPMIATLEQVE